MTIFYNGNPIDIEYAFIDLRGMPSYYTVSQCTGPDVRVDPRKLDPKELRRMIAEEQNDD